MFVIFCLSSVQRNACFTYIYIYIYVYICIYIYISIVRNHYSNYIEYILNINTMNEYIKALLKYLGNERLSVYNYVCGGNKDSE